MDYGETRKLLSGKPLGRGGNGREYIHEAGWRPEDTWQAADTPNDIIPTYRGRAPTPRVSDGGKEMPAFDSSFCVV